MSNPNHKRFWCIVGYPTPINDLQHKRPKGDPWWNQVGRPELGGDNKLTLFFTREDAERVAKERGEKNCYWRFEARKIKKEERT